MNKKLGFEIPQGPPFEQNEEDIKAFFELLDHDEYTIYQKFGARGVDSYHTTKQRFIKTPEEAAKLCKKNRLKGLNCFGINERREGVTKIREGFDKINLLLFDFDVSDKVREKGVAPKEYIKEAKKVVEKSKEKLKDLGFQVDYVAFSGNGFHLGLKVDINLPPYGSGKEWRDSLIYRKLEALEEKLKEFETENIKIDSITKDIARRIKIPGTWNVKSYEKGEKRVLVPREKWRKAKILYLNDNINEEKNNKAFRKTEAKGKEKKREVVVKKGKVKTTDERLNWVLENDEKFRRLYKGEATADYPSRSEAELALACKCAYYGFDVDQVLSNSYIGKWNDTDTHEGYRELTTKKAYTQVDERFDWESWENQGKEEDLRENKEVKGGGEDFEVWINNLYIKKRAPYGDIHIKINNQEYPFDNKKISLQNIRRAASFVAKAEGLEDEKAKEIEIEIFSLKKEAKKKAYESSSKAETQIEREELDIDKEEVEEILKEGYLSELLEEIDEIHKGDKTLKLISICSALSKSINEEPLNLWSVGESGKGKTHLFQTILKTIPKELKVKFNACSPKALYYFCQRYGEESLDGKIAFFNEAEASEEASKVLRSITDPSEEESRLLTVIDQDSIEIRIQGSPVTWFTSVNPLEDTQLKNRFMFGNIEEEIDLDEKVAEHQKKYGRVGILNPIEEQNFDVLKGSFRKIIKETKDLQPIIPFDYEWKRKSDRRLQPMFLNLLYSITKSNYKDRPIKNGKILVTLEDYIIAKKLFSDVEEITTGKVRERDLEILKEIPEAKSQWVSRGDLQEKTNYSYDQIRHSTNRLSDAGYLKKTKDGREWKYWKVKKDVAKSCVSLKEDSLSNKSILNSLEQFNFIAKNEGNTQGKVKSTLISNHLSPSVTNISLATNLFSLEEIKRVLKGENPLNKLSQQIATKLEEREEEESSKLKNDILSYYRKVGEKHISKATEHFQEKGYKSTKINNAVYELLDDKKLIKHPEKKSVLIYQSNGGKEGKTEVEGKEKKEIGRRAEGNGGTTRKREKRNRFNKKERVLEYIENKGPINLGLDSEVDEVANKLGFNVAKTHNFLTELEKEGTIFEGPSGRLRLNN